jgi:hypothetical protein
MLIAGLSELPADRMLSAYHTPVPDTSTLDDTRCAGSTPAAAMNTAAAATTARIIRSTADGDD